MCGHFPIIELCVLSNRVNANQATVGNCCVKKFIGLPSDKIFEAMKRIRNDSAKSANAETIQHAFERHWINEWEKNFYINIMRKRNLAEASSEEGGYQLAHFAELKETLTKKLGNGRSGFPHHIMTLCGPTSLDCENKWTTDPGSAARRSKGRDRLAIYRRVPAVSTRRGLTRGSARPCRMPGCHTKTLMRKLSAPPAEVLPPIAS